MTDLAITFDQLDSIHIELAGLPLPGAWVDLGRCRTAPLNLFFPGRGDVLAVRQAKQICAGCPVLAECRRYALAAPDSLQGVWGGLTARERQRQHQQTTSSDDADDDRVAVGTRAADGALAAALEQLAQHPGRWARIAHYQHPSSAGSAASLLRRNHRDLPAGRWTFEARRSDDGGSDLYAIRHPDIDEVAS